jgi:hypothetical protein
MTTSIDFIIQHLTALKAIAEIELNTNYLFVQAYEPVEFPFEGYKITDVTNRFRMAFTRDVKPKRYKIERPDGSNFVPMAYVEANAVARTVKTRGYSVLDSFADEYPILTDSKILSDIKWTEGIQPVYQSSYKAIKTRKPDDIDMMYYFDTEYVLPKDLVEKFGIIPKKTEPDAGEFREPDGRESETGQPGI